jgi:hypothetical protein
MFFLSQLQDLDYYLPMLRMTVNYTVMASACISAKMMYIYDKCVVLLEIIPSSTQLGSPTLSLCERTIEKLEEIVDPLPHCYLR